MQTSVACGHYSMEFVVFQLLHSEQLLTDFSDKRLCVIASERAAERPEYIALEYMTKGRSQIVSSGTDTGL